MSSTNPSVSTQTSTLLGDTDDSVPITNMAQQNIITSPSIVISKLEVEGYTHEDLKVTIENGYLVIKGSHGEREDGHEGFVSREFALRVEIPKDIIEHEIKAYLFLNKTLFIAAKRLTKIRELPIHLIDEAYESNWRNRRGLERMDAEEQPIVVNPDEMQTTEDEKIDDKMSTEPINEEDTNLNDIDEEDVEEETT